MKRRTQEAYEFVLRKLVELLSDQLENVESISLRTDNESACYNAFEVVFGANGMGKIFNHSLCFFHWRQGIVKKFKQRNKDFFRHDENGKKSKNFKFFLWASYLPLMPVPVIEFLKSVFLEIVPEAFQEMS